MIYYIRLFIIDPEHVPGCSGDVDPRRRGGGSFGLQVCWRHTKGQQQHGRRQKVNIFYLNGGDTVFISSVKIKDRILFS